MTAIKSFLSWLRMSQRDRLACRAINALAGVAYASAPRTDRVKDLRELRDYADALIDNISSEAPR